MKYDTIPVISGMYLSERFEMSLSVPILFAHKSIIAKGSIEVNINDINSNVMNFEVLKMPFSNDNAAHIMINNGMHIIGGFVSVEIPFAIFNLFMYLIIMLFNNKYC